VQDGGLIELKEEVDALGRKLNMRMRIAQRQARLTPTPGGISRVGKIRSKFAGLYDKAKLDKAMHKYEQIGIKGQDIARRPQF
jgi:hypothetical protein